MVVERLVADARCDGNFAAGDHTKANTFWIIQ